MPAGYSDFAGLYEAVTGRVKRVKAEELARAIEGVLGKVLGEGVRVSGLSRMAGGASRETWSFTASPPGSVPIRLVLRRDPSGSLVPGVAREGAVLEAARIAGVPVPKVLVTSADGAAAASAAPSVLEGTSFVVMELVDGETIPRRILRDEKLEPARRVLASQCGQILASIHRIDLAALTDLASGDVLEQTRQLSDWLGEPHPAFELGFEKLAESRPASGDPVLVHGDFRNGNLVVCPEGIRAVLDWELAHVGDPLEDLGWLCAKAWRFGALLPVGGFGTYEELIAAYEAAGGRHVEREDLAWWEALAALRWGVFCVLQAHMHRSGRTRSVELAAIGRRVCEQEWDVLDLIGAPRAPEASPLGGGQGERSGWEPHDAPTAVELLRAVQDFLEGDVTSSTEGRVRFHAKVAANVLGIVARELACGEAGELGHRAELARLGVRSDAELAAAIRSGELDGRMGEVMEVVRATVAAKLAVANPELLRSQL